MRPRVNAIDWIATILVIAGALNWGVVGLFGIDFLAQLFATVPTLLQIIYILVGLSGLYMMFSAYKVTHPTETAYASDEDLRRRR